MKARIGLGLDLGFELSGIRAQIPCSQFQKRLEFPVAHAISTQERRALFGVDACERTVRLQCFE